MPRVDAIQIRNLRSLQNTGFISLKPITILVGRNSAGKSTFARTLPLLRQSVEEIKRAPILWYGRLVDFGSYKDALSRKVDPEEIEFGFRLRLEASFNLADQRAMAYRWFASDLAIIEDTSAELYLTVRQEPSGQGTYASQIKLNLYGNECSISFSDSHTVSEIRVNDFVWESTGEQKHFVTQRRLIPKVEFVRRRRIKDGSTERSIWVEDDHIFSSLKSSVRARVHGNTSEDTIDRMARLIALGSDENMILSLRAMPSTPASWKQGMARLSPNSKWFKQIKNLVFASRLPQILNTLDDHLTSYFLGVKYLEPLRASAQRYYRRQELAIDEIDSKGGNVAMYLDSLNSREKVEFEAWTQQHFGVTIGTVNEGGHIALKLSDSSSSSSTNLADMGFGFSQVLPIAVQLWAATRQERNPLRRAQRGRTTSLVIEQPELHLHPEYQARLADVMLATVREAHAQNREISIIAETHSPHIINRLGQLIEEEQIDRESVQVVLFDRAEGQAFTEVNISKFDKEGILQNWPYGFFEPEVV